MRGKSFAQRRKVSRELARQQSKPVAPPLQASQVDYDEQFNRNMEALSAHQKFAQDKTNHLLLRKQQELRKFINTIKDDQECSDSTTNLRKS